VRGNTRWPAVSSDDRFNPYSPPKARSISEADTDLLPHRLEPRPKPKWATVASYGSDARAVEALKLLEKAEIECRVIQDAPTADTHILAMRSMPLGGHRVQVGADELAEAAKVLGVDADPDETASEPVHQGDKQMKNALLLAGLGVFLCPGPAHLVSIAMVVSTSDFMLTPVGRKQRRWAAVIDLLMFGIIAFVMATNK
jgi:hypothetical protein